jgi:hypothetical protein
MLGSRRRLDATPSAALTNGGLIETAQRMTGHSNAKTAGLFDRCNDDISDGEVERIGI